MFVEFSKSSYALNEGTFVVDPRYKVLSFIGRGAQGLICAAHNTCAVPPEPVSVAVKKFPNAVDEVVACKRMLREVRTMRHFQHENLLSLRDIMFPPSSNVLLWKDVYLVTDQMDTDLHQIISSKQELSDDHVQYFLYQLLAGVAHLHTASIVHRDLKPSNILVNRNCDLKVCDFGLSRACAGPPSKLEEESSQPLNMYVTTRWYRAPELLCFNSGYGLAVDMWSIACILGEMLGRVALFPGRDYLDQLRLVIELLGQPTKEEEALIESEATVEFVRKVNPENAKTLEELLPSASAGSIALLRKVLCFDPSKRSTAMEALLDPYLNQYYSDEDDHTSLPDKHAEWLVDISATDQLLKEQLQNLVFQEMLLFHPEAIHVQWGASAAPGQQASVLEQEVQRQSAAPLEVQAHPEHPRAAHPAQQQMGSAAQAVGPAQHLHGVPVPPPGYSYHPGGIVTAPMPGQPVAIPCQQPAQPQRPHHYQSPSAFYSPQGFGPGFAYPPHPAAAWHCPPGAQPQTMPPGVQPQMLACGAAGQPTGFAPPQPQMVPGQRSMPPGSVAWMHGAQPPQ